MLQKWETYHIHIIKKQTHNKIYKYDIYNKNQTSCNKNIKRIIKASIFATFQQP